MNPMLYVCPMCKGPLDFAGQDYHCPVCSSSYPLVAGIPDFFVAVPGDEDSPVWKENLSWDDPQMAAAREVIYRLSTPDLKGMAFAMQQIAARSFSGCRILEVGLGTGHFTRWMAEVCAPGTEIYAFDYAWPMFDYARANLAGVPGVTLLRANALAPLPFPDESFDFLLLRLAPLGRPDVWNVRVALDLLKPGGWLVKAGWKARPENKPWTEAAIEVGYMCAEAHEWQYTRTRTLEEYAASRVECERAIAFGAPYQPMPEKPASLLMTVWENVRFAQKALR